jgi:hypothetical protein
LDHEVRREFGCSIPAECEATEKVRVFSGFLALFAGFSDAGADPKDGGFGGQSAMGRDSFRWLRAEQGLGCHKKVQFYRLRCGLGERHLGRSVEHLTDGQLELGRDRVR